MKKSSYCFEYFGFQPLEFSIFKTIKSKSMKVKKRNFVDSVLKKEFKKNSKAFLGRYPLQGVDYEDIYGFKPTSTWFKAYQESISSYCIQEDDEFPTVTLENLLTMEAAGISPQVAAECIATYNLVIITPNIYRYLSQSEHVPESAMELAEMLDAAWYDYAVA